MYKNLIKKKKLNLSFSYLMLLTNHLLFIFFTFGKKIIKTFNIIINKKLNTMN